MATDRYRLSTLRQPVELSLASQAIALVDSRDAPGLVALFESLPLRRRPGAQAAAALNRAAAAGHWPCVEALLPFTPSGRRRWALIAAARYGHRPVVERLLPFVPQTSARTLALQRAAFSGHEELVELLRPLADVDEAVRASCTAREWAVVDRLFSCASAKAQRYALAKTASQNRPPMPRLDGLRASLSLERSLDETRAAPAPARRGLRL